MRRCAEFVLRCLACLIVATASSAVAQTVPATKPSTQQSKDLIEILSLGGEDNDWIARTGANPKVDGASITIVQSRGQFAGNWSWVTQVDSRTTGVAQRASGELTLLFDTGHWMSVWSGGGSVGPDLPKGVTPLAIAGGDGALFALARGRLPEIDPTTQPMTRPIARPATRQSTGDAAQLGMFELVRDQWKLRAVVPNLPELTLSGLDDRNVALAVSSSREVFLALKRSPSKIAIIGWKLGAGLSPIAEVESRATSFQILAKLPRPALWVADGGPAGQLHFLDAMNSPPKVLKAPPGLKANEDCYLHEAFGGLRLLYAGEKTFVEQPYSASGELRHGVVEVPLLDNDAASPNSLYEWITLPLTILVTFFLFNPVKQRQNQSAERRLPRRGGDQVPYVILAPFSLRLWAGFVDALPVLAADFYIVAHSPSNQSVSDMFRSSQGIGLLLIATAIYFVHTLVSELLTQRTLGKLIFGLRTVDTAGDRPRTLAIVVRNLIRVVEISMLLLPMLAILFTPLRQRLGDLASNTVVVLNPSTSVKEEKSD